MIIDVLTAFPKILYDPLNESILKQAQRRIDLKIEIHDLREFTRDKHRTLDDSPYGGGPGMILKPEPLFEAMNSIVNHTDKQSQFRVVYPSPQGELFTQEIAQKLSGEDHIIFICGHYKGIDQRVIDQWVTDELSIGDFIVSGGEIPSLLMIDAIVRLHPGVLGDINSARSDSFQNGLLDCPYYTRPEDYNGMKVPEVLLSGNHKAIERWRFEKRIEKTMNRRPDLYQRYMSRKVDKQK
jgi:tRNA (guanine37-N1)-methyltransferase